MKNILFLFCLSAFSISVFAQVKLTPHKISLKNGKSFNLNLPADYEIIPAAEGLKRVRFFAKSPDGRIFVTDMFNLTDNEKGAVYILDDFDAETGKFGKVTPYLTNLKNPNSAQFYTDANGQDWFYLAETDKLTRRKFTRNETKPTDTRPQTLATFPDYGLSYKYGGWHLTRTIAFAPNGKLYVSVGSSCNACDEKEKVRATVLEMDTDGKNQRIFAKGLRNAVGVKWVADNLFATNQGSDHLGLNKPDETFYALKNGADYGWASCYQSNGKVYFDRTKPNELKKPTSRLKSCANVPKSYAFFPAHSSAMGFDYFDSTFSDSALKDSFLVSLHGSTDKDLAKGYKMVIVRKGKKLQDFMTGFLQGKTVHGRPCDIMRLDENSFLFTDDHSGIVYLVRKKK
ncbi:MAG TPA: PQQ-dependent sugar dehydrogenase [Pyrinomonadaceae bacterium]|nr:PQQ-dependent sugar dehydrogenase [Pyrinomonadaceae bacterium]